MSSFLELGFKKIFFLLLAVEMIDKSYSNTAAIKWLMAVYVRNFLLFWLTKATCVNIHTSLGHKYFVSKILFLTQKTQKKTSSIILTFNTRIKMDSILH